MIDSVPARCPYCGEEVELTIDPSGGGFQRYEEDCPVCCRSWSVVVRLDEWGDPQVELGVE